MPEVPLSAVLELHLTGNWRLFVPTCLFVHLQRCLCVMLHLLGWYSSLFSIFYMSFLIFDWITKCVGGINKKLAKPVPVMNVKHGHKASL